MISNGVDPRMVCHYVAVIHVLCEAAADHPFSIKQAERGTLLGRTYTQADQSHQLNDFIRKHRTRLMSAHCAFEKSSGHRNSHPTYSFLLHGKDRTSRIVC